MLADEFVVAHSELQSRPAGQKRQIRNISNRHAWNPKEIRPEESKYIDEQEDLITIVPCLKSPLQHILERSQWFSTQSWVRRKVENDPSFYDPGAFSIVDEDKANAVDTALVLLIGLVMLIVPIWVLDLVAKNSKAKLGIISGFITMFLFSIQGDNGRKARRDMLQLLRKLGKMRWYLYKN
jgi:hypothetical protein